MIKYYKASKDNKIIWCPVPADMIRGKYEAVSGLPINMVYILFDHLNDPDADIILLHTARKGARQLLIGISPEDLSKLEEISREEAENLALML